MAAKENVDQEKHSLRPADSSVLPLMPQERTYYRRIATRATSILRDKYKSGKLKRTGGKRRGHVNRLAVVVVLLTITMAGAIVVAQYQGQFTAQTQIVSPITISQTSFIIPNIATNKTGSLIIDNVFFVDTLGRSVVYTFLVYGAIQINGTQTQDMKTVFYNFNLIFSDYSKNLTSVNLLLPQQPVSFTYMNSASQPFRIIVQYSTKFVQLGASSTPLTISFLYSYSGQ